MQTVLNRLFGIGQIREKEFVRRVMECSGFTEYSHGYKYLPVLFLMAKDCTRMSDQELLDQFYQLNAKQYNTSVANIERNLRNSIKIAEEKGLSPELLGLASSAKLTPCVLANYFYDVFQSYFNTMVVK